MNVDNDTQFVHAEQRGAIGIITIQRPERRNALNLQVKKELVDSLQRMASDESVAAVVLTGYGGYFVAGTDIAEMTTMRPIDHVRLQTDQIFHVLRAMPKPVIAAVEGYALGGGCELALACDILIAAEDARFGQPEIKVGVMPGAGGTQLLLRTAGRYKTLLWTLTGEMVTARDAYTANMVSELVAPGSALERAVKVADVIAAMPPLAVRSIRDAVRQGADASLDTALSLERRLFERLFDSDDQKEGMRAFLEKRPARYHGT